MLKVSSSNKTTTTNNTWASVNRSTCLPGCSLQLLGIHRKEDGLDRKKSGSAKD